MNKIGIAFHGPMGSGKTTAREYLSRKYGFRGIAFADPIKDLARIVQRSTPDTLGDNMWAWVGRAGSRGAITFDWNAYLLWGAVWAASMRFVGLDPFPQREFLQTLGTDIVRRLDRDLWVKWLFGEVGDETLIVVDDVRFSNEAAALKSRGFYCVKLKVDRDEQIRRLVARDGDSFNPERLHHESETDLPDSFFDSVWSPASISELYELIDNLMSIQSKTDRV